MSYSNHILNTFTHVNVKWLGELTSEESNASCRSILKLADNSVGECKFKKNISNRIRLNFNSNLRISNRIKFLQAPLNF